MMWTDIPVLSLYDLQRVEQVIGSPYDPSSSKLHWVRNVAPKKEMYCISFPLTPEMIFGPKMYVSTDSIVTAAITNLWFM